MTILDAFLLICAGGAAVALAWAFLTPRGDRRHPAPPDPRIIEAAQLRITPLDRLGPDRVRIAGDQLYGRLLGDPRLRHHVHHLHQHDLDRLRRQVGDLLAQILGGPARVEVDQLTRLHRRLGATHDTYWTAAGHLVAVLTGLRAPTDIVLHVVEVLIDTQRVIEQAGAKAGAPQRR